MVEQKTSLALGAARVGAVLLALGALGYFVVTAQQNAQSSEPETPSSTPAESNEDYFPSSKSLVIDPDKEQPDHFLPSSKSRILPVNPPKPFGERKPPEADAKKAEGDAKKAEKKDHWLPSSKSMPLPPEVIKGKETKPKPKAQKGSK
ncbi:MAG: hypothetical protein QNJ98_06030 [Planctomycetota bacterium]|nr:hypothetical protein [Planctomycetota bacterium]